jgi:hypothetical protein
MARVKRYVVRFLSLLSVLLAISVSPAAAANWYVDGTLGNDANACTASGFGNACQTIQAAINKASQ